jgi:ribonuclease P protein component
VRAAGLPRETRLRRAADFAALRTPAGRLGSACFRIRYRSNEAGVARLGLAVSRRVSKRAVERNRIKRAVRESFRRVRAQLPPVDLLVIASEAARDRPATQLMAELETLWKRLPPLKPSSPAGTIAG